ncbi:hypothetical protein JZ751_027160 [Albula glossodonta]|uniref:Uncharacterized protein n=1 Tax=Albula glossodonta TaxID=121402 RepID=A0A8T2NKA6_9TELE|nr:hypothetical protein JZ751_014012 [Albula glossodonta]KAG9338082.1 hypothetical protein JZ751_027160 [Albula glossodonta]
MILVSFLSTAVFATVSAFSVSYTMFAVTRALSIEWTDIQHRTFTGTIISMAWSVGSMLLALLAYLIRDWRHLTLAATSPCLVAIISWW